jgi:hypothetical protein
MTSRRTFHDLSDEEVRHLVDSLNSLREGELGVTMLVAVGERAIPSLREFLLFGRRRSIPEPRQRAVRALAELGAKGVLLEYLRAPRHVTDAVVRFAEEAVENTAARALGKWQSEDVFQVLLDIASKRALPGAIETLGMFQRPEAIPCLINALGDDFGRRAAEDALRSVGEAAIPGLVEAARTPDPSRQSESPSSILRRRRAVRVLADCALAPEAWPRLQPLLWDSDHEIAAAVSRIALRVGAKADHAIAFQRIVDALEYVDWLTAIEIDDSLVEHYHELRPSIEAALERRSSTLSPEERIRDRVINTLTRARQRALTTTRER